MTWMTPVYLLLAIVLVLLNGFFVLAEFALVKVRATRIEELSRQGNRRAQIAREMVTRLDAYLSATQLGITVASLGLGWLGEPAFVGIIEAVLELPGWWHGTTSQAISAVLAFLIITFLHILVGELAPKSLAIRRAEQSALAVAVPMRWAYRLFYLPMLLLNGASNLVLHIFGLEAGHPEVAHTEQELRMLLSAVETSGSFSLNRLLMLENIFDLGRQTVRDAMIPWSRVLHVSRATRRDELMRVLAEHRYSRYPVIDPGTGLPDGYLLMKDLIVAGPAAPDWTQVIRPLRVVHPNDCLEVTMSHLQSDGANMAVVMEGARPLGLITLEDILEEVVGRIEDEYPRLPRLFLKDALAAGGVVLNLAAEAPDEAIRTMAAVIPSAHLPSGVDVAMLAMERERQLATDVGHGVAIPHARCPGLAKPLLVFGRSARGIVFNPKSPEPVRLIFLLVSPLERPNLQVFFLSQIASVAQSEFVRERLCRVESADELIEVIGAADPAVTG
jgi:CBS domain containing-hemolysin-like protein